jgi:hypothetical protein
VLPAGLPKSHNRSLTVPSFANSHWADSDAVETDAANPLAVAASHFRRVKVLQSIAHLLG